MKGQAQAVTAVLITGVVVGSVATAYVWGVPLLEKQQSQAEVENVESNVISFRDTIVEVARSGEGTTSEFDLSDGVSNPDNIRVRLNPDKNFIDVRLRGQDPVYPMDTWSLLKGSSFQNLSIGEGQYARRGSDLPGVVAVRAAGAPDSTLLTYRVEFRNMMEDKPSGRQLYRINLTSSGQTRTTGDADIFISNQGTTEAGSDSVKLRSGEIVPRRNTNIRISFQ
ncbi:MAG: hypothetical protein ABEJ56_04805 [Candidatus Nanohaloarchaea archaeon]